VAHDLIDVDGDNGGSDGEKKRRGIVENESQC
jgi:hypothetical protein